MRKENKKRGPWAKKYGVDTKGRQKGRMHGIDTGTECRDHGRAGVGAWGGYFTTCSVAVYVYYRV